MNNIQRGLTPGVVCISVMELVMPVVDIQGILALACL